MSLIAVKNLKIIILGMLFFIPGCGEANNSTQVTIQETNSVEFTAVANIEKEIELGNLAEASQKTEMYIKSIGKEQAINEATKFWRGEPAERNKILGLIMAETLAEKYNHASSSYIAGLGYWDGNVLPANPEKVVRFWDVQGFFNNKVVLQRLADLYSDATLSVYDPALAAKKLAQITDLENQ